MSFCASMWSCGHKRCLVYEPSHVRFSLTPWSLCSVRDGSLPLPILRLTSARVNPAVPRQKSNTQEPAIEKGHDSSHNTFKRARRQLLRQRCVRLLRTSRSNFRLEPRLWREVAMRHSSTCSRTPARGALGRDVSSRGGFTARCVPPKWRAQLESASTAGFHTATRTGLFVDERGASPRGYAHREFLNLSQWRNIASHARLLGVWCRGCALSWSFSHLFTGCFVVCLSDRAVQGQVTLKRLRL